ncbi:MAG TPA: crosslink repair DNA glycosylase YcaQ family protein, partial [Chloroflexota bacterium]|nr:crosslink repair DNA glycosylase YcaQ family protein [Chloroflexota bacterium]
DASLLEVGRRFLHTYGPATTTDFARWWGGAAFATAKRVFRQLGDELTTVDLEGETVTVLASDLADIRSATPQRSVRLLPAFDQYVVGAPRTGSLVLPAQLKLRIYRNQGWFTPVLLVDGRMLGVWWHARSGRRLRIEIEPFEDLPAWVRRGAEEEAERLADFLSGKLELRWQALDASSKVQHQRAQQAAS